MNAVRPPDRHAPQRKGNAPGMDNRPLITPEYGEPAEAMTPDAGLSKADLHMHTNLGDGLASPQKVLEMAKQRGLKVIAITDHDHMEGCKHVQELIDRGEGQGIEMIGVGVVAVGAPGESDSCGMLDDDPLPARRERALEPGSGVFIGSDIRTEGGDVVLAQPHVLVG